MNRRHIISVIIAVFMLFSIIAVFGLRWFSSKPILLVYLRCDSKESGTLSAGIVQKNGELGNKENFDLENACKAGRAEFRKYLNEEDLQFMVIRSDGKTVKTISKYGQDIQRDQNGFYMVLKIMDIPPFIVNDRI